MSDHAADQVAALPKEVLPALAEVFALLEVQPWAGRSLNPDRNPDAAVRTHPFGGSGLGGVVYLILDDQRLVEVLEIVWLG
ncbi:hypothetical protein [Streptosporangium canum]|uniref:hypothetical protein n=1 Tax=Streptosporangium canum TaxID=324952 RepID=UPI00379055E2